MDQYYVEQVIKTVYTFGWIHITDKKKAEDLRDAANKKGHNFYVEKNRDPFSDNYLLIFR